jgi:ribose transport system substrate-binding protein
MYSVNENTSLLTRKKFRILLSTLLIVAITMSMLLSGCGSTTATNDSSAASTTSGETNSQSESSLSGKAFQWGDSNFEEKVKTVSAGKTMKIGFTPPAASEFYDIIQHGANTMMAELTDRFGVKFEFEFAAPSEHQAVEAQVATIENWVSQGFDAILVCSAGDFDSMNSVYEKAMANGTDIYMFNMPAEMWDESELKATSVISWFGCQK